MVGKRDRTRQAQLPTMVNPLHYSTAVNGGSAPSVAGYQYPSLAYLPSRKSGVFVSAQRKPRHRHSVACLLPIWFEPPTHLRDQRRGYAGLDLIAKHERCSCKRPDKLGERIANGWRNEKSHTQPHAVTAKLRSLMQIRNISYISGVMESSNSGHRPYGCACDQKVLPR